MLGMQLDASGRQVLCIPMFVINSKSAESIIANHKNQANHSIFPAYCCNFAIQFFIKQTPAMKLSLKCLLFALLLGATNHATFAQMNDGALFGIKAGVNGANLYDDARADDKKSRIGYTAGIFGQFPIAKGKLSIRPELLFSAKGATFDFSSGNRPEVKLSYVELPLSLQWHIFGFLNVHAGMYAALLADSEGKIRDANGNVLTIDLDKNDYSNVDYGYHLGTGLDIGCLGLHLRVARGLKEVADKGSVQAYLGNLKNATWSLTLGWAF
jgi:outer membrane immunogenic protein